MIKLMGRILISVAMVLTFTLQPVQAELWKCEQGVFKTTPGSGEKCTLVKTTMECRDGERLITGSAKGKGKEGAEKCPVREKAKVESSRAASGISSFNDEVSETGETKDRRTQLKRGGPSVFERMQEQDMAESRQRSQEVMKEVHRQMQMGM